MLFTSYEFLAFLLVLFPVYYLVPTRLQWKVLLIGSYLFYFAADPKYLIYIMTTTLTVFFTARWMGAHTQRQRSYLAAHKEELTKEEKKAYKAGQKRIRKHGMVACMLLNLGILAVLKYTNFAISNINAALEAVGHTGGLSFVSLALPMGISFYTFMAVGYLVDVYRGTVPPEQNLGRFALFVSFFPQLVQGPISRFGDLSQTLYAGHSFDRAVVARGLQRVLWGFFKKMVIADRVLTAVAAMTADPSTYYGAYTFTVMVLYSLELYADFTGGIDITIGIAEALGVHLEENFIRPYFSKSLKEYWRRWHITMGTWFRDYIFYPLSTSHLLQRFTKFCKANLGRWAGRRLPVYVPTFLVWLATGVWHGSSWNFIVWGLVNWAILMLSEECEPLYAKFHARFPGLADTTGYRFFQIMRTVVMLCFLKLFDCYKSPALILHLFVTLFTSRNWGILTDGSMLKLGLTGLDFGILLAGFLVMLAVSLIQRKGSVRDRIAALPYPIRFVIWFGLFLVVLLAGAYGIGYDASQFIYNQF